MPMRPRGILFDMDGTLTEPLLDFPRIKAEMKIGDRPILEALAEMSPSQRRVAEEVLHRHEDEAARNATLNRGCVELLEWLREQAIRTAIVTRNTARSAAIVLELHRLRADALVTRDDGVHKPDPAAVHLACERIGLASSEVWMVGDGEYDIAAAVAAGVPAVWLSHGRVRAFAHGPWIEVRDLCELHELLQQCRPHVAEET